MTTGYLVLVLLSTAVAQGNHFSSEQCSDVNMKSPQIPPVVLESQRRLLPLELETVLPTRLLPGLTNCLVKCLHSINQGEVQTQCQLCRQLPDE